jgi:hypothetical protein
LSDTPHGATVLEHAVEACYAGGHGQPYYQPFFFCSCGFRIRKETWAEVGEALDRHLADAKH